MNIEILTHEELINYAQPQTALEKKLFDACLHFKSEMDNLRCRVNDMSRAFDENEDAQDCLDSLAGVVACALRELNEIQDPSPLVESAIEMLKDAIQQ